jgi:hypothetical protein
LSKGEKTNSSPNKYNLRSKKKEGKSDIPDQPTREENPVKDVVKISRGKKAQNSPLVTKGHVPEVTEILNPPSSFNFEHEIPKIRIPIPLSELVKHEDFERCLSKML